MLVDVLGNLRSPRTYGWTTPVGTAVASRDEKLLVLAHGPALDLEAGHISVFSRDKRSGNNLPS
eukprot:5381986-Prymnesium_polylepis.1